MYWFISDVVISSRKKKERKINLHGCGYLLLLPLFFIPPPPLFKKLAVVFNQWVINYWGAAGWQDARHDEVTAARMLNM